MEPCDSQALERVFYTLSRHSEGPRCVPSALDRGLRLQGARSSLAGGHASAPRRHEEQAKRVCERTSQTMVRTLPRAVEPLHGPLPAFVVPYDVLEVAVVRVARDDPAPERGRCVILRPLTHFPRAAEAIEEP